MKHLLNPKRWLPKPILRSIRRGDPLSLAGVWILCTGCSFNNSFQDGCLGQIRITLPDKGQKQSSPPPKKIARAQTPRPGQIKRATPAGMVAAFVPDRLADSVTNLSPPVEAAAHRALKALNMKWRPQTSWDTHPPGIDHDKPTRHSPPTFRWSRAQYNALLPGVWHLASHNQPTLGLPFPSDQHTKTLFNNEDAESWRERPTTLKVCHHKRATNQGWGRYHFAQNTANAHKACQSGQALGTGRHWHVIDNTYAVTAMPCRVFFSPGRIYLVAQCGTTLYRARIKRAATCLLTGQGNNCRFPHMTLHKMSHEAQQLVEQ
jgi:hypothetical protein